MEQKKTYDRAMIQEWMESNMSLLEDRYQQNDTISWDDFQIFLTVSYDLLSLDKLQEYASATGFTLDEIQEQANDLFQLRDISSSLKINIKESDEEKFSLLSSEQRQSVLNELTSQKQSNFEQISIKAEADIPDLDVL